MNIFLLIVGFAAGGIIVGLLQHYRLRSKTQITFEEAEKLKSQKTEYETRCSILEGDNNTLKSDMASERDKIIELNQRLTKEAADRENSEERLKELKKEVDDLQGKFRAEFENLANRIFEEKSKKFTEQNKENIDQILGPLNKDIGEFRKKVEEAYLNESKDRIALKTQIESLTDMNKQISKEAHNLTTALKGDSKKQGTWGEFRLETVLDKVGLEKGVEYDVQESLKAEDGRRLQPDVIINLPDKKHIVIDSKVSLRAYEQFCNCDDGQEEGFLKEHIKSIKAHVADLSSKNYQKLYQINSPDYVFMFVAIDPAFLIAIQEDRDLFGMAYERGVVMVCPTTLLPVLRIVSSIWRQAKHNKNALEIARKSGDLYDQFVSFVQELRNIGDSIDKSQGYYDKAMKKLKDGRGNLIGRVEKIKQLGAKAQKSIPQDLVEGSEVLIVEDTGN